MHTKTIIVGDSVETLAPGEEQVPNPDLSGTVVKTASVDLTLLHERKKRIIDFLNTGVTINISGEFSHTGDHLQPDLCDIPQAPAPIVFIVSGPGGNGKDTFIDFVSRSCVAKNYTSIEHVYQIAENMASITAKAYDRVSPQTAKVVRNSVMVKTDKYRQLLADVKTIWTKYYNTPYTVMYNHIIDTMSAVACGEHTDCIFLHVRELPAEISKVIDEIESRFGLMCITMEVVGLVDSAEYQNTCDSRVDDYTYDLIIKNHPGDLALFAVQGYVFATMLKDANSLYGLPVSEALEVMPDEDAGQLATSSIHTNNDPSDSGYSI